MEYNNLYDNLKNLGIKKLFIEIKLSIREINDGYQEILIYNGPGSSNKLIFSNDKIEHGPGKKDTSTKYYKFTLCIDIEELGASDFLDIRYGAHGTGNDTWITDYFYYEIMYVVEEEDVNAAEFTWEYQDDIPDSSCNTSFPLEKKQ